MMLIQYTNRLTSGQILTRSIALDTSMHSLRLFAIALMNSPKLRLQLQDVRFGRCAHSCLAFQNGSKISEDRNIEADCLLVSHGFRPITEITSLLRCAHDFNPGKGGWFCKTDFATGATSVETVLRRGR